MPGEMKALRILPQSAARDEERPRQSRDRFDGGAYPLLAPDAGADQDATGQVPRNGKALRWNIVIAFHSVLYFWHDFSGIGPGRRLYAAWRSSGLWSCCWCEQ